MACQRLFCLRWSQQELIMSRLIRPLHFCCPFPWLWATLSSGCWWCDGLWAPCAATCRLHWEWAKVHLVDQRDLLSTPRPRLSWHYKKQRDKRILSAPISFRVLCAFGSLICLAHVDLRLLSNLWNQPHNRACLHTASWGLAVPCCTQGSLSVWEEGLGFHCSWALSEGGKPEAWDGHGKSSVSCRSHACVGGTAGDSCVLYFSSSSMPTESREETCFKRWGCDGRVSSTSGWF